MSDIKEFKVDSRDYFSKSMYYCKEFLKSNKKINIVANTLNANEATRLAETLKRFGYIEFDDIKTETKVVNDTRQVRLVITVHVTSDFDRLYKENEEERKRNQKAKTKINQSSCY